jgi:hypothetical protein
MSITLRSILERWVYGLEVDGTDSGSCQISGFNISDVETWILLPDSQVIILRRMFS